MRKFIIMAFAAIVVITGVMNIPLSWIGNAIVKEHITPRPTFLGTLWKGQIGNIEGINPVYTSIDLRKVLTGTPPVKFQSTSPFLKFSGTANLKGAASAKAQGNIQGLQVFDARFQSLGGSYDLRLDDMIIRENCQSGSGEFSTNVLSENFSQWQWAGPILAGPITCEGGKIIAALSGSDAEQTINIDFRLDIGGEYRASAKVLTADPRAAFILPLFGFEKTANGYSLLEAGAWR